MGRSETPPRRESGKPGRQNKKGEIVRAAARELSRGYAEMKEPPRRAERRGRGAKGEMTKTLGLYLHIPFCVRKCPYCDFYSLPLAGGGAEDYARAALSQMRAWREDLASAPADEGGCGAWDPSVDTVFVGGGTPTALPSETLARLLDGVRETFSPREGSEWTVEANPGNVTREKLYLLRRAGVNRLSLGVQSADDRLLAALGRIHRFADAAESLRLAREVGFTNLSADLMFGIPGEEARSLRTSIERLLALGVTHLSLYALTLEEGTPFWRRAARGDLPLPSEDEVRESYLSACEFLEREGFVHYEISNFALPGRECRHNLRYWRGEQYLGIGPAAHSYLAARRFSLPRSLPAYLRGAPPLRDYLATTPIMSARELREERLILSLRLSKGLPLDFFTARERAALREKISLWQTLRLVRTESGRLSLTPAGMLVSNTLLSDLLLLLDEQSPG